MMPRHGMLRYLLLALTALSIVAAQENQRIAKHFDGILYFGTVVEKNDDKTCRVVYDDGDEEHMNHGNLTESLELYEEHKHKDVPFTVDSDKGIQDYFNPSLLEPSTLQQVSKKLKAGKLVVIKNAFQHEFAEAMHADLMRTTNWTLHEGFNKDGFHYHHHNIYNKGDYSSFMNATFDLFNSPSTKKFMEDLTGRNCSGKINGSPSYYMVGDHSLPHTDWQAQRTVTFVWHLSKNWKPKWGGALFWAQEKDKDHSFCHASFNTLVLFSVSRETSHSVTMVNRLAGKNSRRFAFNGWWNAAWVPSLNDPLEKMLATPKQRRHLTSKQVDTIFEELDLSTVSPKRKKALEKLQDKIDAEYFPEPDTVYTLKL